MSFFKEEEYFEEDETRIRPKLLVKFPFRGFESNWLKVLDEYVALSPGLSFIKKKWCLITVIRSKETSFYTDCQQCLEHFKTAYTENIAVAPIKWFADEMDKKEETNETPYNNNTLAHIRKTIQQTRGTQIVLKKKGEPMSNLVKKLKESDKADSKKRSEDILNLIRNRKKRKGRHNDEE